jgi:hypothetical protein
MLCMLSDVCPVPNLKLCIIRKTHYCLDFSERGRSHVRKIRPEVAGQEVRRYQT